MRIANGARGRRLTWSQAVAGALVAGVVFAWAAAAAGSTPAAGAARRAKPVVGGGVPRSGASSAAFTRTLDAITIEGEIAVPQVLFITSREQPRYRDLLHRRYLRTSVDVGEQVELPSRVLIKESRP